jgi:CPA2 family monovalent cation:H+ antiporter-2
MRRVIRTVQDQREARYNLLRGFFHGSDDNSVDELQHERLATVTLPAFSKEAGLTLGHFSLATIGVRVLSLRRNSGNTQAPLANTSLQEGDILVLSGKAESLAIAEQRLMKGLAVVGIVKGSQ